MLCLPCIFYGFGEIKEHPCYFLLVILGLSTVLAIDSPFRDEILLVGDFVSCLVLVSRAGGQVGMGWVGFGYDVYVLTCYEIDAIFIFFPDYDWVLIA
jgi:uncharacterized membrane protein